MAYQEVTQTAAFQTKKVDQPVSWSHEQDVLCPDPVQQIEDELQLRLDALSELVHSTEDPASVRSKQLSLLPEAEALAQEIAGRRVR